MTNAKLLLHEFIASVTISEDVSEIESIAFVALEEIFGLTRADVLIDKSISVTPEQRARENEFIQRINDHEPIQHIVGYTYFLGNKFIVNRDVLIPRPETEELVIVALDHLQNKKSPCILDLATGSGCIPISLALKRKDCQAYATDISKEALTIANKNKEQLKADVNFFIHDILHEEIKLGKLDLVTSNPPYIAWSEKAGMQKQVVDYEPHLALFVPDDDPLIFYKAIARKAYPVLNAGGMLVVEINQRLASEVSDILMGSGFADVKVRKDISGNDRIVTGVK